MPDNQVENMEDNSNRDRGILSKADREFLRGEKNLTQQSERDARYRIRNRVRNSLLDFEILANYLSDEDREQIFRKLAPWDLVPLYSFLFKGICDNTGELDAGEDFFERIAGNGIDNALLDLDKEHIIHDVSLEVNVDKSKPELDELKRKFMNEEEDMDEFIYMLRHGNLFEEVDSDYVFQRFVSHLDETGLLSELEVENAEETLTAEDYDSVNEFMNDFIASFEGEE